MLAPVGKVWQIIYGDETLTQVPWFDIHQLWLWEAAAAPIIVAYRLLINHYITCVWEKKRFQRKKLVFCKKCLCKFFIFICLCKVKCDCLSLSHIHHICIRTYFVCQLSAKPLAPSNIVCRHHSKHLIIITIADAVIIIVFIVVVPVKVMK